MVLNQFQICPPENPVYSLLAEGPGVAGETDSNWLILSTKERLSEKPLILIGAWDK